MIDLHPTIPILHPPGITPARLGDLPYLVHLSKRHAEELGFLTREAMAEYVRRGQVTLARENGEPCGYFLTSRHRHDTRIFQACVQMDARNLGHARGLLADIISRSHHQTIQQITLHCRDGLESNSFWSACGFKLQTLNLGGSARRKIINVWQLKIADALANPTQPYASEYIARILASGPKNTGEAPSPGLT